MRKDLLSALILLWAILPPQANAKCPQSELEVRVRYVKTIQSQLLAYKLQDEIDEGVPQPLQMQIAAFKDSLVGLADIMLQCEAEDADPKVLESTLVRLLNANRPVQQEVYDPKKPRQLDQIYGDAVTVKVTAPSNAPRLILVEFSFGIECGDDSILLVYDQHIGRWHQVLRWQSGDYSRVDDAFGDFFEYVLVPQPDSGGWLVAVAHGHPWCTSRWSAFDLDLIQPASFASAQKVLQHLGHGYVRFEVEPEMKLVSEGFQIRLETGMIDMDVMTRVGIYRYRVNGTQLERVQPIANNGRDFVDEWLQSPWEDAARWIAPSATAGVKAVHDQIAGERDSKIEEWPARTFGPVRACSDSPSHFQVELDAEWIHAKGNEKPAGSTFFQIEQRKNSFTMLSASERSDSRCGGPDIMRKSH